MLQQLKLGSSKLNSRIIADTVASRSRSRQGRQEEGSKGAEGELGMAGRDNARLDSSCCLGCGCGCGFDKR